MHQPTFYAAVFSIIHDHEGKILFLRRANTGHMDGYLSLPAGHVEPGESITAAMIRELEEEIGINPLKLSVILTQHSMNTEDEKRYLNIFFEVSEYSGSITNAEPEKCSELIFLSPEELKEQKVVPYVREALCSLQEKNVFSEIRWHPHNI